MKLSADTLRVVVAEDEPLTRAQVVRLLEAHPGVAVVGEASGGREAVALVEREQPDLLLLDVQMPGMTGVEVLERLHVWDAVPPVVIFVTAFDQHALRAFELHALDYLVKPFDDERFAQAIERAQARVRAGHLAALGERTVALLRGGTVSGDPEGEPGQLDLSPGGYPARLAVRLAGKITLVRVDDIDWVEGAGVYVRLHVGSKTHLLRETMQRMESQLDPRRFVRIHRSTIVNVDRVRELEPYVRGEYVVYLHDGTQLKLSRGYRGGLQVLLGETE